MAFYPAGKIVLFNFNNKIRLKNKISLKMSKNFLLHNFPNVRPIDYPRSKV